MNKLLDKLLLWACVVLLVSPAISVFLWMLSLAFKNEVDNLAYPPVFIPKPPTFNNFRVVFASGPFFSYLWNSIVVSGLATLVALAVGVPAGYGIARMKARKLMMTILIARMTPAISFLIPLFTLFQAIGLTGTLTAVVENRTLEGTPATHACCEVAAYTSYLIQASKHEFRTVARAA